MSTRIKPISVIGADAIDNLLRGSIDMHIHPAPDPYWVRRVDCMEIAREAQEAGMAGVVVKSFYYPTTVVAEAARHAAADVKVFGSIPVGYVTTGGLQYAAQTIEVNARMGCRVVYFPLMDSRHSKIYLGQNAEEGIYILDDAGHLKPEVYKILDVIKEHNMVLCSGHISYQESYALFSAAKELGIQKMVATHPLAELSAYTLDEIQSLAGLGAYIEHVYGSLMPRLGNMDPSDYVDCIKLIGAERCIMGTDLAQIWDPTPREGMRNFISLMLQFGCTQEEVGLMVKENPRKLLDLKQ